MSDVGDDAATGQPADWSPYRAFFVKNVIFPCSLRPLIDADSVLLYSNSQGNNSFSDLLIFYWGATMTMGSIRSRAIALSIAAFALLITFVLVAPVRAQAQVLVSLTGRVTDSLTGTPLTDSKVTLTDVSGSPREALTDADGRYALDSIPAGTYTLSVEMRGYTSPDPVEIALTGASNVQDFTLEGMTTIVGQVFAADGVTPLVDIALLATGTEEDNLFAAVTDADGFYSFVEMEPDAYTVEPVSVDYLFEARDAGVISRGQPLMGFDFTTIAFSTISGHVYDADGVTPLPEVAVVATREDGESFFTLSGSDGTYSVNQVVGLGQFTVQAYSETALFSEVSTAIVTPESDLMGIDFVVQEPLVPFDQPVLTGSGVLIGHVLTTDTQEPIEGIVITIALITGEGENGIPDVYPLFIEEAPDFIVTDETGTFTIRDLAPGSYQIIAERPDALDILAAADVQDEADLEAALNRAFSIVEVEVAAEGETQITVTLAS